MTQSWKTRAAALLASLTAGAALAPISAAAFLGPTSSESGNSAPASSRSISQLERDEAAITSARSEVTRLAAQVPADEPLARMVLAMEREKAAFDYRQAIRAEQVDLLRVATNPDLVDAVVRDAPPDLGIVVQDTAGAWHAIWRLAGIDEFNLVRIHPRPLDGAAPSAQLVHDYQDSAGHYQMDWTYLASINFIESDFGRVNGPSSAGALGPMQFMPATWAAYGSGADVDNPRDAIEAASRYLFLNGGRRNMPGAIFAYNHDNDYVLAVEYYADAIRHDPDWVDRFYYWNTTG
jgi:soluble lytic murein transglycosylase-like protein